MSNNLKNIADKAFAHITKARINPDYPDAKLYVDTEEMTWADLRDYCDTFTGGEMDCVPLDILTDMLAKRLNDYAQNVAETV